MGGYRSHREVGARSVDLIYPNAIIADPQATTHTLTKDHWRGYTIVAAGSVWASERGARKRTAELSSDVYAREA